MSKRKTIDSFIHDSVLIHGNVYDYSKAIYKSNKKHLIVVCKKHGDFCVRPDNHIFRKSGCPACGLLKLRDVFSDGVDVFIKKAKEIHVDCNGVCLYEYDNVSYVNNRTKVVIKCKKHGNYKQTPEKHILRKQGCPICKCSHGERELHKVLNKYNIKFEIEKTFVTCKDVNVLPFDVVIEDLKLVIEYHGRQHYTPWHFGNHKSEYADYIFDKTKYHDAIKKKWCEKNGYKYVDISYKNFDNIEEILRGHIC